MSHENIFLIGFLLLVGFILVLDLGVLSKKNKSISVKKAAFMSVFVVSLAAGFYILLRYYGFYIHNITSIEKLEYIVNKHHHPIQIIPDNLDKSISIYNQNLAVEFFTGYIVEYALSVDNIFVMLLIFTSFNVAKENYHRVLFWGILGAIVMRFIFIFLGATLISKFDWILYIFGGFLIYSGIKMFFDKDKNEEIDIHNHPVVKFTSKYFNIHHTFIEQKFWAKIDGIFKITPLFLVLIIVEFTDLIFAVDSIPAIFSVTKDPYIVFFSNIFAIIGLRSMFFLLAGFVDKLRYLKLGLAVLLTFIGLKMLFHTYLEHIGFKTLHSLIAIILILCTSIIASLLNPVKNSNLD